MNFLKNTKLVILSVVILILIITNALTFYYFFSKSKNDISQQKTDILNEQNSDKQDDFSKDDDEQKKDSEDFSLEVDDKDNIDSEHQEQEIDSDDDGLSDEDEVNIYKTDPYKKDTDGDGYTDKEEIDSEHDPLVAYEKLDTNMIKIDWQDMPSEASYYSVFNSQVREEFENQEGYGEDYSMDYYMNLGRIFQVGEIIDEDTSDLEVGDKYYVATFPVMGPSFKPYFITFVKSEEDTFLLSNYSSEYKYLDRYKPLFEELKDVQILDYYGPDKISISNSSYNLVRAETNPLELAIDLNESKKLFDYEDGKSVYKTENGKFVVFRDDFSYDEYNLEIGFLGQEGGDLEHSGVTPYKITIKWDNDKETTEEYMFKKDSFFGGGYTYVDVGKDDLKRVGKTENGEVFYVLKDENFTEEGSTIPLLKGIFDSYYNPEEEMSFEEFLAENPVIFWEDPFGDFLMIKDAQFAPVAEMGKPVIYLYPEKKMDVSVQVNPGGGFTITEPEYNNGWFVNASPDGTLHNYRDGREYEYLFWEGIGLNYEIPRKGFVVERGNIKNFLEEKLAKLGLEKKEYDEFVEFWLPRMQEKPYYFVTFLSQEEFDRLAPLEVSPKPDTVIRVFMDFKGLDEKIKVENQEIKTPERQGFTVVEWGGALHD